MTPSVGLTLMGYLSLDSETDCLYCFLRFPKLFCAFPSFLCSLPYKLAWILAKIRVSML